MFTYIEPLNKHTSEKKTIKSRMCKVTAGAALQYIRAYGPSCLCVPAAHQKTLSTLTLIKRWQVYVAGGNK